MRHLATFLTCTVLVSSIGCTDTVRPEPWQLSMPPDAGTGDTAGALPPGTGPRCGPRPDASTSDTFAPSADAAGTNCGCHDDCIDNRCQSGVAEVWKGKYTCTQGVTGITLTVEGSSENLAATFKFYAVPENPDLPTGRYRMTGEMNCNRRFELRPDEWIDRPSDNWYMVGLEGTFDPDRQTISGNVDGGVNCERFTIERAGR